MAVRTRWVVIGTAALLGLVAVAVLPPRSCDAGMRSTSWMVFCRTGVRNAVSQAAVAENARDRLRQGLERRRLADSLMAAGDGRRLTSPTGVTVFYESPLSADSARQWLRLAEREMAMLPGSGTGAPVVLVIQSDPRRQEAGQGGLPIGAARWWYRPQLDRFATSAGGGACVVVVDVGRGAQPEGALRSGRPRLLDWCVLYGRFGSPGAGVRAWAAPAFAFGWRDPWSLAEMVAASRVNGSRAKPSANDDDYRIRACQSGAGRSCLAILGVAGLSSEPTWRGGLRERSRNLLAWLLATQEPEQFARFWRAEGSLARALAEGYGRPADVLLQEWAQAQYAVRARAPMTRPRVLLAGALWFSLAMVAAFVAMQRRQAD